MLLAALLRALPNSRVLEEGPLCSSFHSKESWEEKRPVLKKDSYELTSYVSVPLALQGCDPEVALQTPKPWKIQSDSKVTQKWLKSDFPGFRWKWLKSYSKVTQKWRKRSKKSLLSHFWVTFEPLSPEPRKSLLSHFWVTFLCLWIFRGFGVCRATSGSQLQGFMDNKKCLSLWVQFFGGNFCYKTGTKNMPFSSKMWTPNTPNAKGINLDRDRTRGLLQQGSFHWKKL